jgi:hypothetical protein
LWSIAFAAALACGTGPDAPRSRPTPAVLPTSSAAGAALASPPSARAPGGVDAPPPAPGASAAPADGAAAGGLTRVVRPASAPFAAHPDVLVRLPEGARADRPLGLVLFLHGWYGCVSVVAADEWAPCRAGASAPRAAMGVVGAFDRARVNALLVVPQLAFDAPSSDGGRLERKGGLRALVAELLDDPELAAALGPVRRPEDFARVVVFAHSGAYDPLGPLLAHGGLEAHEIHLLDALYQVPPPLEQWARASAKSLREGAPRSRRLSIIYTDRERTGPRSVSFVRSLLAPLSAPRRGEVAFESAAGPMPAEVELDRPFVLLRTLTTHEEIPRVFLGPLLRTAGLLSLAPPGGDREGP